MQPSDEQLILRVREGDEQAFVMLFRRHEYPVSTLIRYSIDNPADAEDVLQETLLDAWIGLKRVRDPGNARAWLMQVARNRCADYFRSKYRREVATERQELERRLDQTQSSDVRHHTALADAILALREIPRPERETASLFYLDGFTVAEIAERHQCPPGTVKRRLFTARDLLRQRLGVAPPERTNNMNDNTRLFPKALPDIDVVRLAVEPFAVDCREMRYWSIIPEIGECAISADYDPIDGTLRTLGRRRAVRRARIHCVDGVEIEIDNWSEADGWTRDTTCFYGRILEDRVQWLACLTKTDEETKLRTFLDEGFVWAFPDDQRLVSDGDLFDIKPDGSLQTTRAREDFAESGSGYFTVRIGQALFECLRIVGLEGRIDDDEACIKEAYIARNGRMVLMRHYCHSSVAARWNEKVNNEVTITVDDRVFCLFRYTLTGTACGVHA